MFYLIRRVLRLTLHDFTSISIVLLRKTLEDEFKIVHVEVLEVTEAWGAIALIAVIAEETVFIVINDRLASEAANWLVTVIGADHRLA